MPSPLSILSTEARVATLTLNRPDARNAISLDLLEAIDHSLTEIESRKDSLSALIITGAGRSFCAGMDLKAVLGNNALAHELLTRLGLLTLRLRKLPLVTIARVNGAAIGGGCGLACVCDIALTHSDSKMGFPEVDLGVCPAVVAPWLVRKIGPGPARRVLLLGGLMSGAEATQVGIANRALPTLQELDVAVTETASRIASGGPLAIAATKSLLNELDGSLDEALIRRAADLSASVLATDDAQTRLRQKLSN
ncbi:MAG: enoyl-CoA hydratase/isomerase family protein [Phycisphaeraceae bacterium]|nr:enoyl-CoA hydratase/isomerase family protein [Phycisphaeraceae bacterium]MBX3368368.1 enoyl-CoA hydratase/isomerase family protein [Phycisphaeraceae bacterium]